MDARVVVVGSANVDLVLGVPHVVAPGETLLATSSTRGAGGKGANQAVAAARDGAAVTFVGAVGDDPDGAWLRGCLAGEGIDVGPLRTVPGPTGLAVVAVAADGENAITVVPGANHALRELTAADRAHLAAASVVALQLEVPPALVAAAAAVAGGTVVLNAAPAPATALPDALLRAVDVLVVNERERATVGAAADVVAAVVTTLGPRGAVLTRPGRPDLAVPAPRSAAVDTTGAGDTFCGVLAAALARGDGLEAAVRRAVTAGALAVRRAGAQAAMPRAAETDAALH